MLLVVEFEINYMAFGAQPYFPSCVVLLLFRNHGKPCQFRLMPSMIKEDRAHCKALSLLFLMGNDDGIIERARVLPTIGCKGQYQK